MAGTSNGGRKAAQTAKRLYGSNFHSHIGFVGGRKGRTGGFYSNRTLASLAGFKGGKISRRN